jgi:hypothetical protein
MTVHELSQLVLERIWARPKPLQTELVSRILTVTLLDNLKQVKFAQPLVRDRKGLDDELAQPVSHADLVHPPGIPREPQPTTFCVADCDLSGFVVQVREKPVDEWVTTSGSHLL